MNIQTVQSTDAHYISPILGNGEMVTLVGPTGYHDDLRSPHEHPNRTLVWAGRRMSTPTHALIRFGQIRRTLSINAQKTADGNWAQSLNYDEATLTSRLTHDGVVETTTTRISLTENVMIFSTTFHNQRDKNAELRFNISYQFPDEPDDYLNFPTITHFEDPKIEQESLPKHRLQTKQHDDGFSVLYHVNKHLGEVRIGSHPKQDVTLNETGGEIGHVITLAPDESHTCWLWVMLSDRLHFTHFPSFERLDALIGDHHRAWRDYWSQSQLNLEHELLSDFRQTCLFTIRCNASPWSIPPAYLPHYWEGRTFHDELYPFLALLSSSQIKLAERIPRFRLNTLPIAKQYGGGHGARYPWEAIETGEEGGPYGHWMDERFQNAQFVETIWQYYLYTRDEDVLSEFYPVMHACSRFFEYDVLVRDEDGVLKTRLLTDFDESTYPVYNGIFTLCAVIRIFESTAQASNILNIDESQSHRWRAFAEELRDAVPKSTHYLVADGATHWHISQMGSIFPFSIDVDSEIALKTMSQLYEALKTDHNLKPGDAEPYDNTHWMWAASMVATGFFYQGRGDEGYDLLVNILNSCGPFLSCNEQQRLRPNEDPSQQFRLPWFTTSAGAFVYALNSMIIQVDHQGTTLLRGLPAQLKTFSFRRLLASDQVYVSANLVEGRLESLILETHTARQWAFRMPEAIAESASLDGIKVESNLVEITIQLNVGSNQIV